MSSTKFCKDCHYFKPLGQGCVRHTNYDLVTGEVKSVSARDLRETRAACGPEGAWFVAGTERFTSTAPAQEPHYHTPPMPTQPGDDSNFDL